MIKFIIVISNYYILMATIIISIVMVNCYHHHDLLQPNFPKITGWLPSSPEKIQGARCCGLSRASVCATCGGPKLQCQRQGAAGCTGAALWQKWL